MKRFSKNTLVIVLLFFLSTFLVQAQTILNADNTANNTYELINSKLAPGNTAIEAPDQLPDGLHSAFGRHIAEVFDADLNKNVFEFYSHLTPDNDVSGGVDRQRVEIKTYAPSPDNLKGVLGETVVYKWRMKVPIGFQPSASFTHIHQIKAVDGDDSSPIFTLTPRKKSPNNTMQLIYVVDSNGSNDYKAEVNLSLFEGIWVEVIERVKIGTGSIGAYSITIKKVSDGIELLSYTNNAIQTIRTAATDIGSPQVANSFIRPKWGIYRSLTDSGSLRDETIRFSDFSISEIITPTVVVSENTNKTITVTGIAGKGTIVSAIFPDATTGTVTANASTGAYTITSVAGQPSGNIVVSAADTVGNISPSTTVQYLNTNLKIILKLDDVQGISNSTTASLTLNYLVINKLKAALGTVAGRNDASALSVFSSYLNEVNASGEKLFEVWHHGLEHIQFATNPIIYEYQGTPYSYQKSNFDQANQLVLDGLRVQMHSFGAPFNQTDATTNTVISENSNFKVTMFSSPAPDVSTGILNLNNRVNMESATGVPEYDFFVANYNTFKNSYTDYMVLQGHPSVWTSTQLTEFDNIINFLKAEGVEFVTPFEYYLSLNPAFPIPNTTQTISFSPLPNKFKGDSDFSPGATSTSGLTVTYNSSNTAVATIVNGNIRIVGSGSAIITASQMGDATYKPANYVSQTLTVSSKEFRTLASGNWNTPGTWQISDGLGNWTTATTVPNSGNNVYLQSGHTVTVNAAEANCYDLHTNTSGVLAINGTNNVNVNGKIRAYTGLAVISTANGVYVGTSTTTLAAAMITTTSTGVLKFVGATRNITNSGEWTGSGTTNNAVFALDPGAIGTLATAIKFRTIAIASGTVSAVSTINVGSASGNGNITVNSGAKLVSLRNYTAAGAQVITYNSTSKCGTVTIDGTLELTGATPAIDCTIFTGSGTVIFSGGTQTLLQNGSLSTTKGIPITTYGNLIISGTGAKNFPADDITVNNDLKVELSGSITVPMGKNLTVKNNLINTASATAVVVESGANLVQGSSTTVNANTGAITIKRNSNSLFRLDYTLWSSPVASQNLSAFSPLTSTNRFYIYNPGTDLYNSVVPSTSNFAAATGYLIRMPNTDPTTGYDAGTSPLVYPGLFTGIPNNGDVSLNGLASDKYYAVGNPYPSTLNADLFLNGNSTGGTLYFWRKTNAASGTAYATYTLGGITGTLPGTNGITPNGTIQVGQGFIVKTGAAATTLNFTNAMRSANTANQFFKTKNVVERNRIWLNLTSSAGVFSQMLVGYMADATQNFDPGIDGRYLNDSPVALTSNINNEEYTIQGRALPFDPADIVALNFKTDAAGEYTIAIDHVDGFFIDGQDVFLKDNSTGVETDLRAGTYTFSAAAGIDNSRFSLKYQKTLSIKPSAFNENNLRAYKNKGIVYVNSGTVVMDNIKVFDLQGRLIYTLSNINNTVASLSGLSTSKSVIMLRIVSLDNEEITIKVVN
jgi:hypothetical protein